MSSTNHQYNRARNIQNFNEDVQRPAKFEPITEQDNEAALDYFDELISESRKKLED